MSTKLYNITEARGRLAQIGKSIKKGESASFLKNGKPLFVAISQADFDLYQKLLERQKFEIWKKSLTPKMVSEEEEKAFEVAEKENSKKQMTAEEIMNLL